MGSKSTQEAPDTVGAAREQGEQARQLNAEQTRANRPNQYNAWGSTEWVSEPVMNPVTGKYEMQWTQRETLNPMMQSALDSQMGIGAGRSSLAEGAMARAWNDFQNPMDFDRYGGPIGFNPEAGPSDFQFDLSGNRMRAEDAAYQRATNRLDPQFEKREEDLRIRLHNQGLREGDRAYDSAIANLGKERTDAYEMARLGSVGEGRTEMAQDFGQQQSMAQMNAALQGQRFGQGVQSNQIANALRSQQVQEDLFKRGYNLDEVDRLLQGQLVQGGPPSTGGATQSNQSAPSANVANFVG